MWVPFILQQLFTPTTYKRMGQFTNREKSDIHFIYDAENANSRETRRLHEEHFSHRWFHIDSNNCAFVSTAVVIGIRARYQISCRSPNECQNVRHGADYSRYVSRSFTQKYNGWRENPWLGTFQDMASAEWWILARISCSDNPSSNWIGLSSSRAFHLLIPVAECGAFIFSGNRSFHRWIHFTMWWRI